MRRIIGSESLDSGLSEKYLVVSDIYGIIDGAQFTLECLTFATHLITKPNLTKLREICLYSRNNWILL
jgi:hypothetical protein